MQGNLHPPEPAAAPMDRKMEFESGWKDELRLLKGMLYEGRHTACRTVRGRSYDLLLEGGGVPGADCHFMGVGLTKRTAGG